MGTKAEHVVFEAGASIAVPVGVNNDAFVCFWKGKGKPGDASGIAYQSGAKGRQRLSPTAVH